MPLLTTAPTRARLPALAILAVPLLLPACNSNPDQFAPPCPVPIIPPAAGDLQQYRNNSTDPTDLIVRASVGGLSGKCEPGTRGHTKVTVNVALSVTRGPALNSRQVGVNWFLAVLRNGQPLDKQVYPVTVSFPANTVTVAVVPDPVILQLPVSKDVKGSDYQVALGFQLTQEQLDMNRQHPVH
jgi:hypothetical protein